MKLTVLFLSLITFFSVDSKAQLPPDTTLKHSPVRTLTDREYTAYLNGTDLHNMGYVAELNHYPLPDRILEFKKDLDLSPTQITAITGVLKFLAMKKKEIGESVIRNERILDSIFRSSARVDEGMIIFYGNRYGLYEGEYRTAVLQACYKTQKILTDRQVKKFEALKKHN